MSKFPKPMLATNVENFAALKFPKLGSPKLDGIRATAHDGILRSRSLKDIPNPHIQAKLADVAAKYPRLDGELITGSPSGEGVYDRTRRVVMESGKKTNADDTKWYIFDRQIPGDYVHRYTHLLNIENDGVVVVPHLTISNLEELMAFEEACIEKGYEGVMLNSLYDGYKHGRSSEKEGILLKVKRFVEAEATISDCYPEYENTNVATTNELGRMARSAAKDGKVAKDTLGGFEVRSINGAFKGVEHDVAVSPMTHAERKEVWDQYTGKGPGMSPVGKIITYKYFPVGSEAKPRHPLFKGWRDARDMGE